MAIVPPIEQRIDDNRISPGYSPPTFEPLARVRIVERFPWGGPTFAFNGELATVIGMEARYAVLSDAKYGNDHWDYKLDVDGGEHPPIWLPSSAIEPA